VFSPERWFVKRISSYQQIQKQQWFKNKVYLVELQYGELDLLLLTDLLGGGEVLLLPLLGATPQPEDQVEGPLWML
jgi:hypothetical protein